MKHRITLLVLLLTAIAVAVLWFAGNITTPGADVVPPGHSKKTAKAPPTRLQPVEKPAELIELEGRMKELDAQVREARERRAQMETPELMRAANDLNTRGREPSYYALFATWTDVDTQTAEAALSIIRERDAKITESRAQALQKGPEFAKEGRRQRQAIADAAEKKLAPLVGRAHFEEIATLEKSWTEIRPPGFSALTKPPGR